MLPEEFAQCSISPARSRPGPPSCRGATGSQVDAGSALGGGGMHIWVADRSMRELSGTLCYRRCVTSIVLGNYACHRHCVTDIELPATMYVCFEYVCFTARHVRISWGVQRHGFFSKAQVCGAQYPSANQTQGQGLHLPNHMCHPRAPPL